MNTESKTTVVTFKNHPPIKMVEDRISKVYDADPQWGWYVLRCYTTAAGKRIYWSSYNSGTTYGGREPQTHRTFLASTAEIKEQFGDSAWHSEIEAEVAPENILDLTK